MNLEYLGYLQAMIDIVCLERRRTQIIGTGPNNFGGTGSVGTLATVGISSYFVRLEGKGQTGFLFWRRVFLPWFLCVYLSSYCIYLLYL